MNLAKRIAVLSDTHGLLRPEVLEAIDGCDAIIHGGDINKPEIMEKLRQADVLVFATPIYYYEMCGQMKTLLDRMNPLYESDYAFREVYMIATAADGGDATFEKAYNGLQGWVDCFPKAKLCGLVAGEEIGDPKDAVNHPDVMEKAYELGKAL